VIVFAHLESGAGATTPPWDFALFVPHVNTCDGTVPSGSVRLKSLKLNGCHMQSGTKSRVFGTLCNLSLSESDYLNSLEFLSASEAG
jgi:hypothetical protein